MDKITRQSVITLLNKDWADYVARFQSLASAEQAAFLEKQGYKRLTDLLAHIVAWWEEGLQAIQRFQNDPSARQPEINIDSFNARAVEMVRLVSEADEICVFEEARCKFVELVEHLSEQDFKDERVLTQLKWELINHLEDHRIQ
jgi:hypothetical protein